MNKIANTDPETGVAYGVIKGHSVMELVDEIQSNGDSVNRAAAIDELKRNLIGVIEDYTRNAEGVVEKVIDDIVQELEFEFDEESYTYKTNDGYEYMLGYLGGAILIWCSKSPHVTWARQCSPCVPNAGDLDNPSPDQSGVLCYCPHIESIDEDIRNQMTVAEAADPTKIVRARAVPNEE